jgi:hypothetical protein
MQFRDRLETLSRSAVKLDLYGLRAAPSVADAAALSSAPADGFRDAGPGVTLRTWP